MAAKMTDALELMEQQEVLEEYLPKALSTIQDEAKDLEYLAPGIAGEVGELLGHVAKAHWHHTPEEDLCRELAFEYGDVAWMTAVLLHVTDGADLSAPSAVARRVNTWATDHPLESLFGRAAAILRAKNDGDVDRLRQQAQHMWSALSTMAEPATGYTFDEILEMNSAKLADRAARGTLKGNGDHR